VEHELRAGHGPDGTQPASYISDSWQHTYQQFPDQALHLRFTDSHEQTRAVARYGMAGALAGQVLMLTLDGRSTILQRHGSG